MPNDPCTPATTEAGRLAAELTAAFPCDEHGGSDEALRMGAIPVDASTLMEAAAELRRLEARVARLEAGK